MITELEDKKLTYAKKVLSHMASLAMSDAKYLRYKRDIMQSSSFDRLEMIGKSLITEICS
jgi:hypothetical protein